MIVVSGPTQSALRTRYPISTERLLLRPLSAHDVEALLAYRSRPDVCRYVLASRFTVAAGHAQC